MSRQLLTHLNGDKNGYLKSFLDKFKGEPRIAWYPSAGRDFRALLYLHPRYQEFNPALGSEPQTPDLFLFTDYYPWGDSSFFFDSRTLYRDNKTEVYVESIEELPRLNLPLHSEIVSFPEGSEATDRVLFLQICVNSNILGSFSFPVIYAFAENESFYCKKLVPNKAKISHIIQVCYGSGFGGSRASGVWIPNVLKELSCEVFITDVKSFQWLSGDEYTLRMCRSIPRESEALLTPIRVMPRNRYQWFYTWNLVAHEE